MSYLTTESLNSSYHFSKLGDCGLLMKKDEGQALPSGLVLLHICCGSILTSSQLLDCSYRAHFNLTSIMDPCELRNSFPQTEDKWSASSAESWAQYPPGLGKCTITFLPCNRHLLMFARLRSQSSTCGCMFERNMDVRLVQNWDLG